jgi:hypothetical protein
LNILSGVTVHLLYAIYKLLYSIIFWPANIYTQILYQQRREGKQ